MLRFPRLRRLGAATLRRPRRVALGVASGAAAADEATIAYVESRRRRPADPGLGAAGRHHRPRQRRGRPSTARTPMSTRVPGRVHDHDQAHHRCSRSTPASPWPASGSRRPRTPPDLPRLRARRRLRRHRHLRLRRRDPAHAHPGPGRGPDRHRRPDPGQGDEPLRRRPRRRRRDRRRGPAGRAGPLRWRGHHRHRARRRHRRARRQRRASSTSSRSRRRARPSRRWSRWPRPVAAA